MINALHTYLKFTVHVHGLLMSEKSQQITYIQPSEQGKWLFYTHTLK